MIQQLEAQISDTEENDTDIQFATVAAMSSFRTGAPGLKMTLAGEQLKRAGGPTDTNVERGNQMTVETIDLTQAVMSVGEFLSTNVPVLDWILGSMLVTTAPLVNGLNQILEKFLPES
jgi:ethanolamine utilization microcompartment shell protein EutL